MFRLGLLPAEFLRLNEVNDRIDMLQPHVTLRHQEDQDRAPELSMLDALSQSTDRNFPRQLFVTPEPFHLAVAECLIRCVVVRRLPDVNARKWYAMVELERLSRDPAWLDKAIRLVDRLVRQANGKLKGKDSEEALAG